MSGLVKFTGRIKVRNKIKIGLLQPARSHSKLIRGIFSDDELPVLDRVSTVDFLRRFVEPIGGFREPFLSATSTQAKFWKFLALSRNCHQKWFLPRRAEVWHRTKRHYQRWTRENWGGMVGSDVLRIVLRLEQDLHDRRFTFGSKIPRTSDMLTNKVFHRKYKATLEVPDLSFGLILRYHTNCFWLKSFFI